MTNSSSVTPDNPLFDSLLEVAAVKRQVVDIRFLNEEAWKKIFVKKVRYHQEDLLIEPLSGDPFPKSAVKEIMVSVDHDDLEAISCLCG